MSRKKNLNIYVIKTVLMLFLLGLPIYLLGLVPGMQALSDPRKFLFTQNDFSDFNYAIIGDSVFCSYYVDSINDTIWKRFEALTGQQCFPSALNGATIADMVDSSKALATRLPKGSTVFVGLIPTRFVGKGIVRHRNYFNDFQQLKISRDASYLKQAASKITDFVLGDFLLYTEPYSLMKFLRKIKGTFDTGHKAWDVEAWEKSSQRYRRFVDSQKRLTTFIDTVAIGQIHDSLAARNITAVFVLSALNQGLINKLSEPDEASDLIKKFRTTRDDLVVHFSDSGMEYIDLFDKIDSHCFSDLVHLNTCGDDVMAKAFANYALHKDLKN